MVVQQKESFCCILCPLTDTHIHTNTKCYPEEILDIKKYKNIKSVIEQGKGIHYTSYGSAIYK